jgi:nicotinamidase-related amidase
MTTLENRPNSALLVVDVQNDVGGGAHGRNSVVANIGGLVDRARRERVPVIWVEHSDEEITYGSDGWRTVPELRPEEFIAHTNLYWGYQTAPGRTADVVATEDVDFG